MNRPATLTAFVIAFFVFPLTTSAQSSKIVTAAQANGIYRYYDNEIRILALGKNKLRVSFDGIYHTLSKSVNTGSTEGEATIEGNVAILDLSEFGPCKITIVFLRNNRIKVTQDGSDADCGFGHNVYATGTYRKVRGGKPKFEPPV